MTVQVRIPLRKNPLILQEGRGDRFGCRVQGQDMHYFPVKKRTKPS